MDCDIVPYSPDLDDEIARLQSHLWGDDLDRNAAYLKWKYAENPYLDDILIQAARCDGDLVGMRGMFGTLWEVDDAGSRHLLPYADDFVISPAHRNRGVASRIMQASHEEARRRGFRLAINLSAGPVTFVSSLAAGWRCSGSFRQLDYRRAPSAPIRPLKSVVPQRLYQRVATMVRSIAPRGVFDRLDQARADASSMISVHRQPRPQAMATLVSRLPWDGRIRHVRDQRYFSWRFRNPLHEYRFLFAGAVDCQGYLVLQRHLSRWADPHLVNIADWEATNDGVAAALLDAALDWGRLERVRVWSVSASPEIRSLLGARGFNASASPGVRARSAGLLLRWLNDMPEAPELLGNRNPLSIADWDLRMLYSMAA